MSDTVNKVVLAYSGGLDTSVILKWLIQTYGCEVIAFSADLGQGDEMSRVEENALKTGATKVYIDDLKEAFVKDYVFPAFRANAVYEGQYLLGTSLARPLIAMRQVEIARKFGADAVSHGATGKGNDQVRFEMAYMALEPGLKIIAPWRIWDFKGREDLVNYAKLKNIPVPVTKDKPYSSDRNLLHISFEGGILEDTWKEPDEEMFVLSVSPEKAPDRATYMEIEFKNGNPVDVENDEEIYYSFKLEQNYPNPFNPSTKIKFTIPQDVRGKTQEVILKVYDVLANEVVTLINEELLPGVYEVEFNVGQASIPVLPSGIYFCQLKAGSFIQTNKMLLLR